MASTVLLLVDPIIKAMHEAAWIDDFVLVGLVVIAENGGSETALEVDLLEATTGVVYFVVQIDMGLRKADARLAVGPVTEIHGPGGLNQMRDLDEGRLPVYRAGIVAGGFSLEFDELQDF